MSLDLLKMIYGNIRFYEIRIQDPVPETEPVLMVSEKCKFNFGAGVKGGGGGC